METAIADENAETLHEWRKHTKYHWHHLSLLSGSAPDLLGKTANLLDRLAELLGNHHNLHVLGAWLADQPGPVDKESVAAIEAVIVARQADLAEKAFGLGRQLSAEKPGALRRRFEHYWQLLPEQE